MISTNGLLTCFREQGREDKIAALEFFIAVGMEHQGEDLTPVSPHENVDLVIIDCATSFEAPADYNFN